MTEPDAYDLEQPTAELRWVDVGGMKPILQQLWISRGAEVWRDVPTVQEKR